MNNPYQVIPEHGSNPQNQNIQTSMSSMGGHLPQGGPPGYVQAISTQHVPPQMAMPHNPQSQQHRPNPQQQMLRDISLNQPQHHPSYNNPSQYTQSQQSGNTQPSVHQVEPIHQHEPMAAYDTNMQPANPRVSTNVHKNTPQGVSNQQGNIQQTDDSWKTDAYRDGIKRRIELQLEKFPQPDAERSSKASEWERQLFERSKSKRDYEYFVQKLLSRLEDHCGPPKPKPIIPPDVPPEVPIPGPGHPEEYRQQLRRCRRYIEPLTRTIARIEPISERKEDYTKMKQLREFLIQDEKQLPLETLKKFETVLKGWTEQSSDRNKPGPTISVATKDSKDSNVTTQVKSSLTDLGTTSGAPICQPLIDAVHQTYKNKYEFHRSFSRSFSIPLAVLAKRSFAEFNTPTFPNQNVQSYSTQKSEPDTKRLKMEHVNHDDDESSNRQFHTPYSGPPHVPDMLQGEVVRLPHRYKVTLDRSCYIRAEYNITSMKQLELFQQKQSSIILSCSISIFADRKLPYLKVAIPRDYPKSPPTSVASKLDWENTKHSKLVYKEFEKRIQLGNVKTLTQLLTILETSILQYGFQNE